MTGVRLAQRTRRHSRIARSLAVAAIAAAASLASPASAVAQTGQGQTFLAPTGPNTFLQSLNIGQFSGTTAGATYYLNLYSYAGIGTNGAALFSQMFTGPVSQYTTVTPNINLTGGNVYAFLLESSTGGTSLFTTGDAYTNGHAVNCFVGTCGPNFAFPSSPNDIADFSVTFGPSITTTPEPSSLALLGTGLVGLVPMLRRRRK